MYRCSEFNELFFKTSRGRAFFTVVQCAVFIPHAVIIQCYFGSKMDIDVSKENIQPLRGGRNLVQLGAALQAQSDVDAQRQLQLQKE